MNNNGVDFRWISFNRDRWEKKEEGHRRVEADMKLQVITVFQCWQLAASRGDAGAA